MALSSLYFLPIQDKALKKEPVFLFLQALHCVALFLSLSFHLRQIILWQQCHASLPLPVEMESFLLWMGEKAVHFWMTALEAMQEQSFSICEKSHTAAHLLLQQTGSAGFWCLKFPRSCVSWVLEFGWPHFCSCLCSCPGQYLWAMAFVSSEVFPFVVPQGPQCKPHLSHLQVAPAKAVSRGLQEPLSHHKKAFQLILGTTSNHSEVFLSTAL